MPGFGLDEVAGERNFDTRPTRGPRGLGFPIRISAPAEPYVARATAPQSTRHGRRPRRSAPRSPDCIVRPRRRGLAVLRVHQAGPEPPQQLGLVLLRKHSTPSSEAARRASLWRCAPTSCRCRVEHVADALSHRLRESCLLATRARLSGSLQWATQSEASPARASHRPCKGSRWVRTRAPESART